MIYKSIDITQAAVCNVSEDSAKEFIDHRIQIKKKLTQQAFDRAMKAAANCQALHGINPDKAVEVTIDMGWQGLVVEYVVNELKRREKVANINNGVAYETGNRFAGNNQRPSRSERADSQLFSVINGGRK